MTTTAKETRHQKRERVVRACADRGLRIIPRGIAFQISGIGVDILIADLVLITLPHDLKPA